MGETEQAAAIQQLGQRMAEGGIDRWRLMVLTIDAADDNVIDLSVVAHRPNLPPQEVSVPPAVSIAAMCLRKQFLEDHGKAPRRIQMSLSPEGEFDLELAY
jgi:hypothetical protein